MRSISIIGEASIVLRGILARGGICAGMRGVRLYSARKAPTQSLSGKKAPATTQNNAIYDEAQYTEYQPVSGPTSNPRTHQPSSPPSPSPSPSSHQNVQGEMDFETINALTEAERVSGIKLNYPKLVSVGNQSSGKSSVLTAITGEEILPTGSFMVTKRPLHVTLIRTQTGRWAEFEDGTKLYDMTEVQKRIARENQIVGDSVVSDVPIYVKIYSPDVYNLCVTDLPGYISVVRHGEDRSVPKKIKDLARPIIEDENTIPVVVTSATDDPANCMGLKEIYKHGAQNRSIGVITKMDLPTNLDETLQLLKNEMYPLQHGFFGVVLRSSDAIKNGATVQSQLAKEKQFFKSKGLDPNDYREDDMGINEATLKWKCNLNLGVEKLRRSLSDILLRQIVPQLPSVMTELDAIINKLQNSQNFLEKLAEETDLDTISRDLTVIVKKLHTESSFRTSFEKGFRDVLQQQIRDLIMAEFKAQFKWETVVEPTQSTTQSTKSTSPQTNHQQRQEVDGEYRYVDEIGDKHTAVTNSISNILYIESFLKPDDFMGKKFDVDRLTRTFIFGENSPEKVTDGIFHNLKTKHVMSGMLLSYYNFRFPDDRNVLRVEWVECLDRAISKLIEPDNKNNLQTVSFELVMKELFAFINTIQIDHSDSGKTDLAREFGKYLFDKIGRQIYGKDLGSAMYHHMNTEKRPDPNFQEMGIELLKIAPPKALYKWLGSVERKDIQIFGYEWTRAYAEILSRRVTDNLFKSIGVNLLDPLIQEAIRFTLQTFRGDHVAEEAEKQSGKINALKKHRETLRAAVERYSSSVNTKN